MGRITLPGISRQDAYQCVGPGWKALLDKAYDKIEEEARVEDHVEVHQVKEKFGGLRIYADGSYSLQDFLDLLEEESLRICEMCGKPGSQNATGYWISTLCGGCREKRR